MPLGDTHVLAAAIDAQPPQRHDVRSTAAKMIRPSHAGRHRMDLYAEQVLCLLDELGVDQAGHLTIRTGRSVRCMTLCAVLPRMNPARSLRPREPITMTSASCSIAASTISRAA